MFGQYLRLGFAAEPSVVKPIDTIVQ